MNPEYLGDSYDIVKRFFCHELSILGYAVVIDAMLTGNWSKDSEQKFHRFIGAEPQVGAPPIHARTSLFLDPDTGINAKGGKQHVSFDRLAREATDYKLVFAFDQSFSRQVKAKMVMREKLLDLASRGCHAMYYDSHARFVFVTREGAALDELHSHLLSLGMPALRMFRVDA